MEGRYVEEVVKEGSSEKVTFELKYLTKYREEVSRWGETSDVTIVRKVCFQCMFEKE